MYKLGPLTESNAQTQSLSKEPNQRVLLAASRVTHFQLHFSMFKSTFSSCSRKIWQMKLIPPWLNHHEWQKQDIVSLTDH